MRSLPGRALLACILVACLDKPPGLPESNGKPEPVAIPTQPSATASARPNANPDESKSKDLDRNDEEDDRASPEPTSNKDPFLGGTFTLADATATLSGTGALVATIKTSMGPLKCKLFDDKAPITVANFVGLARGVRPWRARDGHWVKRPIYDGTTFHRVIKGFMIQGGDPNGDGTGEPGYVIPDEIWPGAKHDRPGQLCMANRGPNTNGAQFFITDANGSIPHLDKSYTIFGECEPVSVVHTIARVPTDRSSDRPLTPVTIHTIEITREASGRADAPSAPNAASATKPAPGCSGCGRGDPLSPTY